MKDMFTGKEVDIPIRKKQQSGPKQASLFTVAETVEIGAIRHHKHYDNLEPAPLVLEIVDLRTPEQREADLMKEAQKLTGSFLEEK